MPRKTTTTPLSLLLRYLAFWFRSGNAHSVHSPFVFDLYTRVIRPAPPHPAFDPIEKIRAQLLTSTHEIQTVDLGAGSRVSRSLRRRVKDVARYAQKDARTGQLLFRLVNHFVPQTIFDLGTSLGVTTSYLAAPNPRAAVYTFEGCPQTLSIAQHNFAQLGYGHIHPVPGNLDETLPATLREVTLLDFVFFDANHRREPTLRYFTTCLEKAHEDSVFVFDDIYWSSEMMAAWEEIKNHPAVTLTVDLFHVGLVFFRRKQPKQHFTLR
jgi:predicted O-methyltransferase YrrM